jgi:deazaflavin-dependent oxidoreductase (nitroreductase family)
MARLARLRHLLTRLRPLSVGWTRLHVRLLRASKGRLRFGFLFAGNVPILALTTKGRKSGEQRSSVVGYLSHGDGYAVVASNAGSDRTPAWWLNLQADPDCEIDVDGERVSARARLAEAGEREELWRRFAAANESYEHYRGYTQRELPVVVLDRVSNTRA